MCDHYHHHHDEDDEDDDDTTRSHLQANISQSPVTSVASDSKNHMGTLFLVGKMRKRGKNKIH